MTKVFIRLGLIALLVFAGVTFWYGRVEKKLESTAPAEQAQTSEPSPSAKEGSVPAAPDHKVILTRNIFQTGVETVKAAGTANGSADETNTDELAETRMQLVLLGTVTGSREDARAIIRDQTTKLEEIYRIGSELNGASIVRITRGKVVLKVNGREEVLVIKDPEATGPGQGGRMSTAPSRRESGGGRPPQVEAETGQKVPEAMPRRRISFREAQPPAPAPAVPEGQPAQPEQAVQGEVPPPAPPEPVPAQPPPPEPPAQEDVAPAMPAESVPVQPFPEPGE